MQKLTDRLAVILLIVLFLGAMSWIGKVESDDELIDQRRYCEMIALNKTSKGAYGWPDDGRECK